jgi:amino-acid N-acetyltransferase
MALAVIIPLEQADVLVRRSREHLEMEIDHFAIMERDGMIIACAAVHPFFANKEAHNKKNDKEQMAELACLAVHPEYRGIGRGNALLKYIEQHAIEQGMQKLFAFSTKSSHWFIERGFKKADIKALPMKRKALYNYKRNSKVFIKLLS